MTTFDFWKAALVVKAAMIFLCFTILSIGNDMLFIILGILILILGCFMAFRQGAAIGHEACGVSHSVARIQEDPAKAKQIDKHMLKGVYSISSGVTAMFACALMPYIINVAYIVIRLMNLQDWMIFVSRFLAFVESIMFWPLIVHWHANFTALSTDIILVLMVGPFVIPAFQFLGYLQGPKMWEKTEKAMADGRRRAKARSRITRKKKLPKSQRPEI